MLWNSKGEPFYFVCLSEYGSKIGSGGISLVRAKIGPILYSSGDNSVAGNGNVSCKSKNCRRMMHRGGSDGDIQPLIP